MNGLVVGITRAQYLGQTDAWDAIVHIGCMQTELSVTQQDIVDMSELVEVILYALDDHHGLTAFIDGQRHILHTLCSHIDLRQLAYLRQYGVIGGYRLALYRHHLQLWVDVREERGYQIVESVKNGKRNHQRHRSHSDTYNRDAANHINSVSGLLGE